MRTVKEAQVRKNEIMDAAMRLFAEKGYDKTSTNDILEAVGIARGTLYHHFKSKEDIMDALIERQMEQLLSAAREAAADRSTAVPERFLRVIGALRVGGGEGGGEAMIEHLHKPQNALMHQKINKILIQQVPQILADVVKDGIEEGMFETLYPLECMEMIVVYMKTIFDDGILELTEQEAAGRIHAFIVHLERMLHAKPGQLDFMLKIFESVSEE